MSQRPDKRSTTPPGIETSVERRRSPRAPVVVRVSYATVDALFTEFTRNINEGGLFIETENPPPPETRVTLHFQLPGDPTPLQVSGRVAWSSAGDGTTPPGMGVEFEALDPRDRARINELVRRLRADRPPAEAPAKTH